MTEAVVVAVRMLDFDAIKLEAGDRVMLVARADDDELDHEAAEASVHELERKFPGVRFTVVSGLAEVKVQRA
jgi:hypothetical protein